MEVVKKSQVFYHKQHMRSFQHLGGLAPQTLDHGLDDSFSKSIKHLTLTIYGDIQSSLNLLPWISVKHATSIHWNVLALTDYTILLNYSLRPYICLLAVPMLFSMTITIKPLQLMMMMMSSRCKSLLILSIFSVNITQAFPVTQLGVPN